MEAINNNIVNIDHLENLIAQLPDGRELYVLYQDLLNADAGANTNALISEGYAVGKKNGVDVGEGSLYYHNNAKWYAKLAMQSTPEGYEQLVEDVDTLYNNSYVQSAHGTDLNIVTAEGGIKIDHINGHSTQKGTPSQSSPIAILSGGEIYKYNGINTLDYGKAYPKTGSMTGKVNSDRYNCLTNMIQLKAGDSYKIEFDSRVNIGVHTYDTRELSLWAEYYAFETFTNSVQYDSYIGIDIEKEYTGKILVSVNGKYIDFTDDYKLIIKEHSKNILPITASSEEGFEMLDDGKIHVFGNFTGNHIFKLSDGFMMEKGWYIISGVPEELRSKILMDITLNDNTHIKTYSPFSLGQNRSVKKVELVLNDAGNVDFVLEPMIEQVDSSGAIATEYVPYKTANFKIPLLEPIRSVGNICDIIKNIDGVWKVERNIAYIDSYEGQSISTDYISSTGALTTGASVQYVKAIPTYETIADQEVFERLISFKDSTNIKGDYGNADLFIEYGKSDGVALGLRGDNAFDLADMKQSKLNASQLTAINSGVTSEKVANYDKAVSDITTLNTNLSQLSDEVDDLAEETTEIKSDLSQYNAIGRSLELDTEVGGIVVNEILGNSEQGENPSPTNPQPIHSSGDDGGIRVEIENSNLIKYPFFHTSGRLNNGITYIVNADNSISISGTSTSSNSSFYFNDYEQRWKLKPNKNYKCYLLGNTDANVKATIFFTLNGTSAYKSLSYSNSFEITKEYIQEMEEAGYIAYRLAIQVSSNTGSHNVTVYPLLVEQNADGTYPTNYVPYSHKSIFIPLAEPLRSVGDKHDRIVKKDGKWVVERRIKNIASYNGESITTAYMSTTGQLTNGAEVNYVLNTPTYEEIQDQTALYLLESYADKTYISTADGLAELNVNYGKSDAISLGLMGYNAFRLAENQLA